MKSILLFVLANIRKRKLQNILIGFILFLSSVMLSTSISLISGTNSPFDKMYEQLKTSHFLLYLDSDVYNPEELTRWWMKQSEVEAVETYNSFSISGFYYEETMIEIACHITERPNYEMDLDHLSFLTSIYGDSIPLTPESGECWIPAFIAESHGIEINDTIRLPLDQGMRELSVAAIVVDPQYNSSFGDGVRIWIESGGLTTLIPLSLLNKSVLSIRIGDTNQIDRIWKRFTEYLGGSFTGVDSNYVMIKTANTMLYIISGAGLMAISIIIFIIAIFLIYANISNFILSDFKVIGILKSLGFTPGQFPLAYMIQFIILSFLFIVPGLISAGFISRALLMMVARNMGVSSIELNVVMMNLLSFFLLTGMVGITSFLIARKAAGVKPSQAIQYGMPQKNYKKNHSISLTGQFHWNLSAFIGFRNISNKKGRLFNTLISFTLAIVIAAVSLNFIQTLNVIIGDMGIWGFPDPDLTISRNSGISRSMTHNRFMEILSEKGEIEDIVEFSDSVNISIVDIESGVPELISSFILSDNMGTVHIGNLEGRNPSGINEISIGLGLSRKYHKEIGETIELYVEGQMREYTISGIYQSGNRMGLNIRMSMESYKVLNPLFETTDYLINLKEGVSTADFIEWIDNHFGMSADARLKTKYHEAASISFSSTISGMIALFSIITLIFLIIAFIIISNDVVMQCMELKRGFGILKSIGMTPLQLRLSFVFQSLIIMLICLLMALPLAAVITPVVMRFVFSFASLIQFPVQVHWFGNLLLIPFFIFIAIISAWVPSAQVTKIKARELITE